MAKKAKKKFNLFDKIILIINVLCALGLLLSYFAPITDPRSLSIIAILGFGYQVLFILNILLVLYWLIRRWVYALISGLTILAGFTILTANFGFHFQSVIDNKVAKDDIRIMEYNVHELLGIEENEGQPTKEKIFQLIKEKQPDIISIEEFVVKKTDKGSIEDSIKKVLHTNHYYFKPFLISSKDSAGNAIFTKLPIIDTGSVHGPTFLNTKAIYVDLKYKSKILRVYCIHLAAVEMLEDEKRKYLSGNLNFTSALFIENKLKSAFLMRSYQVAKIKQHMSECPYPYIVTGDFNDTPISYSVNEISDGLKNAFIEKGSGLGTTYFSKFPKLHIDYILVSPQFDVLNYQTIDKKISDHKPILSDLRLN